MRRLFLFLTIILSLAAKTMDDEIISNLDFLQNMDLVKDEDNLDLQEDLEDIMVESPDELEPQDE